MTSSHSQTLVNLYGKGIDEPSEWGHREIDGQAREGNGRDEWERTSQILMRYDPTLTQEPRTFYCQHDHEGSVTHLADGSGNVIEKYRYDVFGTPTMYDGSGHVLPNGSAFSNRFLFTGGEYAAAFGFYEYRARAYHPGLGRFMSEDPKLFDAGDYNLFRYCHNDPIDFTDPMGCIASPRDSPTSRKGTWKRRRKPQQISFSQQQTESMPP
jgi:RHS repeat-associated protein